MGKYQSPGVYGTVTNQSQMTALATSTTFAVVMQASRGPLGPRYISSSKELLNLFGNPDQDAALAMWAALEITKQRGALWVNNISHGDYVLAHLSWRNDVAAPVAGAALDPWGVAWHADDIFRVAAIGPGTYYNSIGVAVTALDATRGLVTIVVYHVNSPNTVLETFTFTLSSQLSAGGVQRFAEDVVNGNSKYIEIRVNPSFDELPILTVTKPYFAGNTAGTAADDSDVTDGWEEFKNTKKYDVTVLVNGGYATVPVHTKMIEVATYRGDALAILDLPATELEAEDAVTWRNDTLILTSRFGYLVGPRYGIYSPYDDRTVFVPISGGVAAAIAYSDSVKDVWWAFAGPNRGKIPNAVSLETEWEQADCDLLYPKSINPVVNEPGIGIMLLGNRTLLQDDSSLWSANVHRLVCALVKSCLAGLRFYLMEQNDDYLGRSIEVSLSEVCETVKSGRGLYRYAVVSNSTNNSPADIDALTRNVQVYLQPTRAAEIIAFEAIITRTGVEFSVTSTTNQPL
jgi:hypothetical protein